MIYDHMTLLKARECDSNPNIVQNYSITLYNSEQYHTEQPSECRRHSAASHRHGALHEARVEGLEWEVSGARQIVLVDLQHPLEEARLEQVVVLLVLDVVSARAGDDVRPALHQRRHPQPGQHHQYEVLAVRLHGLHALAPLQLGVDVGRVVQQLGDLTGVLVQPSGRADELRYDVDQGRAAGDAGQSQLLAQRLHEVEQVRVVCQAVAGCVVLPLDVEEALHVLADDGPELGQVDGDGEVLRPVLGHRIVCRLAFAPRMREGGVLVNARPLLSWPVLLLLLLSPSATVGLSTTPTPTLTLPLTVVPHLDAHAGVDPVGQCAELVVGVDPVAHVDELVVVECPHAVDQAAVVDQSQRGLVVDGHSAEREWFQEYTKCVVVLQALAGGVTVVRSATYSEEIQTRAREDQRSNICIWSDSTARAGHDSCACTILGAEIRAAEEIVERAGHDKADVACHA